MARKKLSALLLVKWQVSDDSDFRLDDAKFNSDSSAHPRKHFPQICYRRRLGAARQGRADRQGFTVALKPRQE